MLNTHSSPISNSPSVTQRTGEGCDGSGRDALVPQGCQGRGGRPGITSAGRSALFVQTDVDREDDIVALVEKTVGVFGALHIAFNNAGTEGYFGPCS